MQWKYSSIPQNNMRILKYSKVILICLILFTFACPFIFEFIKTFRIAPLNLFYKPGLLSRTLEKSKLLRNNLVNLFLSQQNSNFSQSNHSPSAYEIESFENYRSTQLTNMSQIIQDRLHHLQNPLDCFKAPKFICSLLGCGLGCQFHRLFNCFHESFRQNRTLIMNWRNWEYEQNWTDIFQPISPNCNQSWEFYANKTENNNVILNQEKAFSIDYYPLEFAQILESTHEEPHIWWVGQFFKYFLKLLPHIQDKFDNFKQKIGFKKPIIGLHVRRTDKYVENKYHLLAEYMTHAAEYFDILDQKYSKVHERTIFLATDEIEIIQEAQERYKNWTFLVDIEGTLRAQKSNRHESLSLFAILNSIFLLADCDFIVCTFSSNVCRLVYEIMQSKYTSEDVTGRFISLDQFHHLHNGRALYQMAIQSHTSSQFTNLNEIELKVGDRIQIAGRFQDGFSMGTNLETNQVGLYPSHKARYYLERLI